LGGLLYMAAIYVISRIVEGRRHAADRLWQALIYSAFIIAIAPLLAILGTVVVRGIKVLSVEFLTTSMRNVSPRDPGGGVYHALIGTIEQVLLAALVGVPIGIMVAIYLVEYAPTGRLRTSITFFVDVMTGIPSIVAGLFIYTWFVLTLGFERSGFAGSLALAILLIPVVVRGARS
jgi:phosphate transport system permease protein